MRQLGTLPDPQSARTFCDYLQSLSIETRLEQAPEGNVVWILDEDKVPRAREELQAFLQLPTDERFQTSPRPPAEAPPPPLPAPRLRTRGSDWAGRPDCQLTIGLMVLSVLVTVLYHSPPQQSLVTDNLFITRVEVTDKKLFRWFPGLPELSARQYWRALTPMFIHFDPWHLLFNMLWLYALGSQIERRSGPLRLGLLVVITSAISNLCQYHFSEVRFDRDTWLPVVALSSPAFGGMSGVVFGLFGYIWLRTRYQPNCGLSITPGTVFLMIVWLFVCMTGGVGPVANTAHLVGLVVGMVAGYVAARWQNFGQRDDNP